MPQLTTHELAHAFALHGDIKRRLAYHTNYNLFYYYEDGWYRKLEQLTIERMVYQFLLDQARQRSLKVVNTTIVREIIMQLRWVLPLAFDRENTEYLALKDCLLNLHDFTTREFTEELFVTYTLPFAWQQLRTLTPNFDRFLRTSLVKKDNVHETDVELVDMVQQMMGFFLVDSLKGAAAFFLVGEGANGKSILLNVIREMIGREFCAAMKIESLTTNRFATANLIGKKINISNEEESKYIHSDTFKALVTGEMIQAEYKLGKSFEFIPRTKYIFASNNIPTFQNLDYGLLRRIFIIPFYRRFMPDDPDRDINLEDKLLLELPGIVGWAIEGAKKFVANNYVLSQAKASLQAKREFENEISSSLLFIRENYVVLSGCFVGNDDLYLAYREWCYKNGKQPKNSTNFFTDINRHIPGIEEVWNTDEKGKRIRGKNLGFAIDVQQTPVDTVKF